MKKKVAILVVAIVAAFLIGGIFIGSQIGASSGWSNELTSEVNKQLGAVGFEKKEEILQSDITAEMKEVLDPKIAEEEAALKKMLEEYYELKLQGLENSPEFAELEKKIEQIRLSIFNRYKVEIDSMFNGTWPFKNPLFYRGFRG